METIKLSISVMAHPSRAKHFDFLSKKLQIPISEFCIDQQNNLLEFSNAGVELPVINKGFFGDIPDDKYPEKICFAFFDGDFYGSIMDSFKKVYNKMVPGGIILIHDYEYAPFPGVKKACDDFLTGRPEVIVKNIFGIGKVVKA